MGLFVTERQAGARVVAIICFSIGVVQVSAAEINYNLNTGVAHSDNIHRATENPEDETIVGAGIGFTILEQTRRLELDAFGDLGYFDYLNDTYGSQLLGNAYGSARFGLLPERIVWYVSDSYGQQRIDRTVADTPDNRSSINYFSTGPEFTIPLGRRNQLELLGTYANVNYEGTRPDENRYGAEAGITRTLSGTSSIGVRANTVETRYDNENTLSNNRRDEGFLRYEFLNARTRITVDAGYARLRYTQTHTTDDSWLGRFDLSREISSASTVHFGGGRRFSTSADLLAQEQSTQGTDLNAEILPETEEPFRLDYLYAGWLFDRNRTLVEFDMSINKENHERLTELNSTWWGATLYLRRQLSSKFAVYLAGDYLDQDISGSNTAVEEIGATIGTRYRISTRVWADLHGGRFIRTGSDDIIRYHENQIWLEFSYGLGEPRRQYGGVVSQGIR